MLKTFKQTHFTPLSFYQFNMERVPKAGEGVNTSHAIPPSQKEIDVHFWEGILLIIMIFYQKTHNFSAIILLLNNLKTFKRNLLRVFSDNYIALNF